MFKQNYIFYIIFIFLFLIYKNQKKNILENFIDTCQYRLQSFNNMFVLVDKNNNIVKKFNSKKQYLNYVKYELKDTECIISDTVTEYTNEKFEKEKKLKKKNREQTEMLEKYTKFEKDIEEIKKNQREQLEFLKNKNKNNSNNNHINNLIKEQQESNKININKNMKENKSYEIQMNLENIKKTNVRDANKYAQCFKLHNECLNNNEPSKCNMRECLLKDDIIRENIKKQYESDMKKNIYSYRHNWTMPQAQPPICITENNKKCEVCPTFIDKDVNNLLQIKDVDDSIFENWKEGNKINKNFNIITSEWKQKNDIAEPQNYIPPKCPFDDCQPCNEILMNNSEHPSVIIGKNLLPKFKYEEY
jgi:hypothetical protein